MKLSIPQIPAYALKSGAPSPGIPIAQAVERVHDFLQAGKGSTVVLTGAGVSVDSGIRPYRGRHGVYTVNKNHRPIFFHEFMASETQRKRYWSRSYIGFRPVELSQPNPAHYILSYLLQVGYLSNLITQNVDALHLRSLPPSSPFRQSIIELHGTLSTIHCTNEQCKEVYDRSWFTHEVELLNPAWMELSNRIRHNGEKVVLNPDGDVDLGPINYNNFNVPPCPSCHTGILKPSLIFFGESLPNYVRQAAEASVTQSSRLLIIGTSLATYSSYRLFKQALEEGKEVGIINIGETRADREVEMGLAWKVEQGATELLKLIAERMKTGRGEGEELLSQGRVRLVDGEEYAS